MAPPSRFLSVVVSLVGLPALAADPPKAVDFAHDVVPILKAHCAKCHTNGTYKSGLSLDTRAELLKAKVAVPGKSAESEIIKRVTHTDTEMRMPPTGDPLSKKEIAVLAKWIDDGLPWVGHRVYTPFDSH